MDQEKMSERLSAANFMMVEGTQECALCSPKPGAEVGRRAPMTWDTNQRRPGRIRPGRPPMDQARPSDPGRRLAADAQLPEGDIRPPLQRRGNVGPRSLRTPLTRPSPHRAGA